ncbi:hypothetical protein SVIOM74S_05021 [Streptomyces violarus]
MLLGGLAVFGVGSALAAFSGSPGELIAFRAVMGLGAAFVMPATLAVLMNVFEREEQPGTVIAPRRAAILAAVRRAVAAGELRDDLDVELMDDLFVGAVLVRTVHRPDAPLPDDLVDRIITTLLQGLAPAAGRV